MTIKGYIKKNGWQSECDMSKTFRAMNVQIEFINDDEKEDETEFSISAYDEKELNELFSEFCKENNLKRNTVTYITIVEVAETMELLT